MSEAYEKFARADGWITDEEMHPGRGPHHGVVHPLGWWAPDWKAAYFGYGNHKKLPRPLNDDPGFVEFWKVLKNFAKAYELPEPPYDEARKCYAEFKTRKQEA